MAALVLVLLAACVMDYRQARIPNLCILMLLAAGICFRLWGSGIRGLLEYGSISVLVLFLFYPLFKIGAVGAGDVKLLAAAAGYFSGNSIILFLFYSLLVSAIFSGLKLIADRSWGERLRYLCSYLMNTAVSGQWNRYFKSEADRKIAGIRLSGPVFLSILLHLGGVY